jgi:WW domain-containing oxidoreductase
MIRPGFWTGTTGMTTTIRFNGRTSADQVLAGHDLSARTVLVTGANGGIGFETARALAAAGARVLLGCRNRTTGEDAVARIRAHHPQARADFLALDLGSLASVRTACASLAGTALDTIICNAGLIAPSYAQTAEGFEKTVGVCHVGHFALVQGLLPQLLANAASRVVMVASESHRSPATLDFDNFPSREKGYFAMRSYGQAKLCNVLMANELQRRYAAQGLMACSLHPGTMVTTNIGSESALVRFAMKLVSPFTKDCNQGAATSVWAVVHEPAAELGAQYLRDCRIDRATPEGRDAQVAAKLWDLSERWLAEHPAR